ncbi:unnamed protein product [Rotaria sordida]|uniref:Methyltransferase type 11 domain-containing protein n=1 Tax=Rotaria sordida TaxID=392033 RepID=A0A814B3V6_9BILA|nr:unnamed protein product [Rotaria sordida]
MASSRKLKYASEVSNPNKSPINNDVTQNMKNPVVNHRLTILEELINNQINKENVQIKQLQDKIEILEEELQQHKIQIKHLEDQVMNDASTTSKSVTSKSNVVQPTTSSEEFHSIIKDQDIIKSTENKEKKRSIQSGNFLFTSWMDSREDNFSLWASAKDSLQEWQFQTRSDHRLAEIKSMFEFDRTCPSSFGSLKISSSSSDLKEIISRASINAYFDMICRDDSTTVEIGEYLNLSKENIFGGTDYDSHNDKVTFVDVNLNQSTIDLADNRVDLITCFVTLHHVPQLKLILSEFVRILRPSGYLIIREHNCENKRSLTAKYLNFVHAFMMIAHVGEFADDQRNHLNQNEVQSDDDSVSHTIDWKQKKLNIIKYTKSIQYRTRTEWQQEIENVGFHLKATLEYDQSTLKNPQELFYAVFQLNVK